MKDYFLKTKRLGLRPLLLEDARGYWNWFNDEEICKFNSHHKIPMTLQDAEEYIKQSSGKNSLIVLAIEELSAQKHIGNISLQNIDYLNRSAEMAFMIGNRESWGKSYATEAGAALLKHAFFTLNLHRVYLGTAENNIGMQHVAAKLGFTLEGRRKEALFKDNQYRDILEYGILKRDFEGIEKNV